MAINRRVRRALAPALMVAATGCSITGTGDARIVRQDEQRVEIAVPELTPRTKRYAEQLARIAVGEVEFDRSEEVDSGKVRGKTRHRPLGFGEKTETVTEKEHVLTYRVKSVGG